MLSVGEQRSVRSEHFQCEQDRSEQDRIEIASTGFSLVCRFDRQVLKLNNFDDVLGVLTDPRL